MMFTLSFVVSISSCTADKSMFLRSFLKKPDMGFVEIMRESKSLTEIASEMGVEMKGIINEAKTFRIMYGY